MSKDFTTVRGRMDVGPDLPREERDAPLIYDDIEEEASYPRIRDPYGYFITQESHGR